MSFGYTQVNAQAAEIAREAASRMNERHHDIQSHMIETGRDLLAGSINVEAIEIMGARNVAAGQRGGLAQVSLEQVLAWDPEVIVTIDQDFARTVHDDPGWGGVAAVRAGRVHLSPKLPFGWVDFPPSVNRLVSRSREPAAVVTNNNTNQHRCRCPRNSLTCYRTCFIGERPTS